MPALAGAGVELPVPALGYKPALLGAMRSGSPKRMERPDSLSEPARPEFDSGSVGSELSKLPEVGRAAECSGSRTSGCTPPAKDSPPVEPPVEPPAEPIPP